MTRADLAAWIGERYGAYLDAASRSATDSAGNLKAPIDDALMTLGYAEAALPTVVITETSPIADARAATAYQVMSQIVRDLAVLFDLGTSGGGNYRLSQMRAAAEKDLLSAQAAAEARGLPLTVEPEGLVAVWDLNFLG